jgi:uncharacterized protein YecE (DUF72 family)
MQPHTQFVKIGTSGIGVPGAKADYPPEFQSGTRLNYYGSLFNSLEINSSFYKVPMAKTFAKWATEVPDDFEFTVKLWRGITHQKRLEFAPEDIELFMRAANELGQKKGCILIQFPASITVSYLAQVESILRGVREVDQEGRWKIAVELRHPSWYHIAAYSMFERYQAAVVFHDMPNSKTPPDCPVMQHVYCRYHGPTGRYNGSYTPEFLQQVAENIVAWQAQQKTVYVYFNNTMEGALDNAQALQNLLEPSRML